jgi:predicted  nucleic acid-binding Zn-ribbon protein
VRCGSTPRPYHRAESLSNRRTGACCTLQVREGLREKVHRNLTIFLPVSILIVTQCVYRQQTAKGDEELTKKIQKSIDKFDKYGDDLLKQIQRHNKLQSEIETTTEEIESLNDAIEDIRIDAYKASQEAIDNLKDIKESAAELDKLFRDFDDSSFINKFSIDDTPYGDLIEDLSKLDNMYSVTKEDANKFYQDLIDQKKNALKNTKDEDEKKAIQKSIDFFTEQQANLENGRASLENGLLGLAQQDLARLQG